MIFYEGNLITWNYNGRLEICCISDSNNDHLQFLCDAIVNRAKLILIDSLLYENKNSVPKGAFELF